MTDRNEALRLAQALKNRQEAEDDAADMLIQQAERIAELEGELLKRHQRLHDTEELAWQYLAQRDDATTERDQLRAEVERLRAIGSQLANVAFNWSQEANGTGQRLSAEDRDLLKSLQMQWDQARTTHKDEG